MPFDLFLDKMAEDRLPLIDATLAARRIPRGSEPILPPGFVGISVELEVAAAVARDLAASGVACRIMEAKYREPQLPLSLAQEVAAREIARLRRQAHRGEVFGRIELIRETPMWWTFFSASESLIEKGRVPGGVLCAIDKFDGRVVDAAAQARAHELMHAWQGWPAGRPT
ncbi:hypothetical protein [Eleftheria terrae]|uniref:hypothetical protein n=1 Tax=Eleftheria terrae TaxID=1597781 RepID=UPI00263AD4EE|nr:hypothetical protein [Eleftheria terrae]WKB51690.1 hypothetical protein N7L95_18075 [Eleftheria terrae]